MARKQVYLDNAATTPIAPEVVDAMLPILKDYYGNPSSSHAFGRSVRAQIEYARRSIAKAFKGLLQLKLYLQIRWHRGR